MWEIRNEEEENKRKRGMRRGSEEDRDRGKLSVAGPQPGPRNVSYIEGPIASTHSPREEIFAQPVFIPCPNFFLTTNIIF